MEGKASEVPDGAKRPTLVLTHYPLGRVLYDLEAVAMGYIHYCIHLAGDSCVMNGYYRLRFFSDRFLYLFFIDIHGVRPDIDEDQLCAKEHRRVCGR